MNASASGGVRRVVPWTKVIWVAILSGIPWSVACTSTPSLPGIGGNSEAPGGATAGAPCTTGTTEPCYETIGNHDGVLTCFKGTQTCLKGTWSACGGTGEFETSFKPVKAGGIAPLSFSQPKGCADNP